jgi:diguanylate cyclase (GGDEF)-like protein
MSILDVLRKRPASPPAPPSAAASPSPTRSGAGVDAALPVVELVGSMLKTWAKHPLLVGTEEREAVEAQLGEWARHATLGSPLSQHQDGGRSRAGIADRDWDGLARLTAARRKAEVDAATEQLQELQGIIWETVGSLTAVAEVEATSDARVINEMSRVKYLTQSGDAKALLRELPSVLQRVTETIRDRQARAQLERRALAARVDTLGRALSAAERAARTDALTGAGNRMRFEEDADRALQMMTLSGTPVSLLVLDCDGFKQINDRHGHAAGDAALQAVAKSCFMVCSRPSDSICRIGGDEFAIILPGTERVAAAMLADRLEERLRDTPVPLTTDVRMCVPAAIGWATAVPGEGREAWIARADANQYEAKRKHRAA